MEDVKCPTGRGITIAEPGHRRESKPVLDAFPHDEEVALDEPLDDLAVPLLPRAQLAGRWHRLVTTREHRVKR